MKKKRIRGSSGSFAMLPKIYRIMKLLCLFMFVALLQVSASTYAQSTKLNISGNNLTLEEVFEKIEDQSEFSFIYNLKQIDLSKKVDVEFKNQKVEKILNEILEGTNITYTVNNRLIVVHRDGEASALLSAVDQQKSLTGKVSDEQGLPLPGVTVVIKGTTNGSVTNMDGNYTIANIPDGATLQFSFVGMLTQEVPVGNNSTINVTMVMDAIGIEEVVAIGYGTQKKVNLTGAVETINTTEIRSRPLTNSSQALQGKVAGAFVTQNSGQPGNDDADIFIRGVGTFGNNNPLVIVDGVPSSLNDVNPKDIASVSVLKDAASTAIYGNRASNGVILVTTNRGSSEKMEVSYTGYYGVQSVTTMPEMLKGVEYLELMAEANYNTNKAYPSWYNDEFMDPYRNNVDPERYPTDQVWADILFQPANILDNHVSISGGNKRFQYAASVGYLDQDGIVIGNSTEKLTMRINLSSYFLNDKLKLDLRASGYDQTTQDMVDGMNTSIYYVYLGAPTSPTSIPGYGYTDYNFAASDQGGYLNTRKSPVNVHFGAEFNILKGLDFSTSYSINRESYEQERWAPKVTTYGYDEDGNVLETPSPQTSGLKFERRESVRKEFRTMLNYSTDIFEDLNLSAMGAMETREYRQDYVMASRQNYAVALPELGNGDPGSQMNDGSAVEAAWLSYFGRVKLNYKGKYLFESTFRKDGSSRFRDKWGTFPSLAAGWRISEESIIKDNADWLANLKLRASWGKLGNESINQYYAAYDELSLSLVNDFGSTLQQAAAITKLANKATSWETSEQLNFGLDFGIFDNELSGTIEYYVKENSNILMQIPVSGTLGLTTVPFQNRGSMRNKGFEFQLNYSKKFGEVKFNGSINASHVNNEVIELGDLDEIINGSFITRVGSSFNSFYALGAEGIYQSQDEINQHLTFTDSDGNPINPYIGLTPEPGDIKFTDQNNDGIINSSDKTIIGQSFPDWTFSSTFNFEWKNFDMSLFFQGVQGINSMNRFFVTVPFTSGSANTGAWYRDAWTEENPSETIQKLNVDLTRGETDSEYYLEDGSYIRLKNIELGYSIPKHILSKVGISNLRIFGNIQNAFTSTKMRYGFDPEKPSGTTSTLQYPQTRITSIGINLKF